MNMVATTPRTWRIAIATATMACLSVGKSVSGAPQPGVAAEQKRAQEKVLEEAPRTVAGIPKEKLLFYSRLWPLHAQIKVAFDGEHKELYKRVAALAQQWTEDTTIAFDFGKADEFYGWSAIDKDYRYPVRVGFAPDAFYSYMGSECALAAPNEKTISLTPPEGDNDKRWEWSVLHEFGHVLGIPHIFNHPDARADISADGVDRVFGPAARSLLFTPADLNWTPLRPFPPSVMSYMFTEEMLVHGRESRWFQPRPIAALSVYDRQLVHLMYGKDADRPAVGAVRLVSGDTPSQASTEPSYELVTNEIYRLMDPVTVFKILLATNYACKVTASEDFEHPVNKQVFRQNDPVGTGFLVSESIVMTCNHVVPDLDTAGKVKVDFEYARDQLSPGGNSIAQYQVEKLAYSSSEGDFSLLRLRSVGNELPGKLLKYYNLGESKREPKDLYRAPFRVTVVQYPDGKRLQVALNEEATLVTMGTKSELQYQVDTLGGSSGSPVFSFYGRLVGMHQAHGPIDESRPSIPPKSKYNIGIPINRILEEMYDKCPAAVLAELGLK
jgi:V8-like Glu-specific endopeptidase